MRRDFCFGFLERNKQRSHDFFRDPGTRGRPKKGAVHRTSAFLVLYLPKSSAVSWQIPPTLLTKPPLPQKLDSQKQPTLPQEFSIKGAFDATIFSRLLFLDRIAPNDLQDEVIHRLIENLENG